RHPAGSLWHHGAGIHHRSRYAVRTDGGTGDKNASQEEVNSAIEVLNTRLSEVSFIIEKPNNKEENNSLENKDDQKHENGSSKNNKIIGEKVKAENFIKDSDFENKSLEKGNKKSLNVETGVGSLKGILLSLSFALVGLFKTKRK
ncbi:MAG: hypothetical protein E7E32_05170, partial [Anaerococcus hydrogenalis]|nr:hypothetical protein [Anaerococcus hydrogenalis]